MRRRNYKKYKTARDTQKLKVYRFGWEVRDRINGRIETEEECIKFINKAHRWWYGDTQNKLAEVPVKFRNGYGGNSWYQPRNNTIFIKRYWGKHKWNLLHELTHYIIGRSTRKEFRCDAPHGKIFMRIFATLLARFTELSMTEIKAIAKKHKAKMCGLKDSNGKNIRRKLKQS